MLLGLDLLELLLLLLLLHEPLSLVLFSCESLVILATDSTAITISTNLQLKVYVTLISRGVAITQSHLVKRIG